jgi:steroid 5-alpha reductase family enzyme
MDIGWGLGFILIALISYLKNPPDLKNVLLLMVVTSWGLRLALYIFSRSRGKEEDPRYTKLRNAWKPHENLQAYIKVFLFQGFLMLIVSLPVSVGMSAGEGNVSLINWLGLLIWSGGFLFEVWSDNYLRWWKSQPENEGKICTTGPWKLCRFPNYFGEVSLWYGVYFLAFDFNIAWTIIGPFTLNFFILKVTGVPLLEERYQDRQAYQDYAKRVPRFIPFTRA